MADRLYRAQILLDPGQHAELRAIAAREGRSISEVARAMLALGLRQAQLEKQRQLDVIEQMAGLRRQIAEEHGVYMGDPVAEARAEREADIVMAIGPDKP